MSTALLGAVHEAEVADVETLRSELDRAIARLTHSNALNCVLVSDYSPGDPAATKMEQALGAYLRHHAESVSFHSHVSVPPLQTRRGGFRMAMLALGPEHLWGPNTVYYLNVAPIEHKDSRNGGHRFCAALLTNGVVVFSPDACQSFAELRPYIRAYFVLECDQEGKQFRSWQVFPEVIGSLLGKDDNVVSHVLANGSRPVYPETESLAIDIDNFGNLRLRVSREELEALGFVWGERVTVLRNGIPVARAIFGDPKGGRTPDDCSFSIKPGSNIVVPGGELPPVTLLDLFGVGDSADDQIAWEISTFKNKRLFAWLEGYVVASTVVANYGWLRGIKAFLSVTRERREERKRKVGKHCRRVPVITFAKAE